MNFQGEYEHVISPEYSSQYPSKAGPKYKQAQICYSLHLKKEEDEATFFETNLSLFTTTR